jgi:Zn-dependent protease
VTRENRLTAGLPLGSLAGIPLRLAPTWLIGAVVITVVYAPLVRRLVPGTSDLASVLVGVTLALLLGLSVLLHELGHCVAALRAGIGVRQVHLSLLGGSTELARDPRTPRAEAVIAGAGPAVSVVLAVTAVLAWRFGTGPGPLTLPSLLLLQVGLANAAVAVSNLLPGLPLDGGRVLRALVWGITGRPSSGTAAARIGSVVVALLLAAWGVHGLATGGSSAWLQAVVAAVLVLVVLDGARNPEEQPEPVTVLPATTALVHAVTVGGAVLVTDDLGRTRGVLDRAHGVALLHRRPDALLGEATTLLLPEQLVPQHADLTAARDRLGPGAAIVVLGADSHPVGVLL